MIKAFCSSKAVVDVLRMYSLSVGDPCNKAVSCHILFSTQWCYVHLVDRAYLHCPKRLKKKKKKKKKKTTKNTQYFSISDNTTLANLTDQTFLIDNCPEFKILSQHTVSGRKRIGPNKQLYGVKFILSVSITQMLLFYNFLAINGFFQKSIDSQERYLMRIA